MTSHLTTTPMRWGVGNIIFLCRSGNYIQFVAKAFGGINLLLPTQRRNGGLANMPFLCRSGHSIQFLAKQIVSRSFDPHLHNHEGYVVGKNDLSVNIWTFHTIPSKQKFCKLIPPHGEGGMRNMSLDILCNS